MKKSVLMTIIGLLLICPMGAAGADLSADQIMTHLEARYNVPGFYVRFHQVTTMTSLDITYDGDGQIYIKQPGRMRWEYESPDRQFYITDGTSLWVWSPDENQVMIGKAATYFGEGKGGSFLSDITSIRKSFLVEIMPSDLAECFLLKLTPIKPTADIQEVLLTVSKETFTILQVSTDYASGNVTRYTFDLPEFDRQMDDSLFVFSIPDGADIISLEE
jgi:outer membrane lipoprotein carrier protein